MVGILLSYRESVDRPPNAQRVDGNSVHGEPVACWRKSGDHAIRELTSRRFGRVLVPCSSPRRAHLAGRDASSSTPAAGRASMRVACGTPPAEWVGGRPSDEPEGGT